MFSLHAAEAVLLLGWLVVPALFLLGLYWVVRLAVRAALREVRSDPVGATDVSASWRPPTG